MEGVERMNVVMMWPQQRIGFVQRNSYAMDMDRREGRNCYNCREFRHVVRHYKNRGVENRIGESRRLEYGNRKNNRQRRIEEENREQNLNGK